MNRTYDFLKNNRNSDLHIRFFEAIASQDYFQSLIRKANQNAD